MTISDHLFYTRDGRPRRDGVDPGCDPATTLAAIAGLSDRLEVQTIVMNAAWIHPALLLRFSQPLAALVQLPFALRLFLEAFFPLGRIALFIFLLLFALFLFTGLLNFLLGLLLGTGGGSELRFSSFCDAGEVG